MIELRWVEREAKIVGNRLDWEPYMERVLQYRTLQGYMDASGALNVARAKWSPWTDVPVVKEEK